jgi:hypothetical protein
MRVRAAWAALASLQIYLGGVAIQNEASGGLPGSIDGFPPCTKAELVRIPQKILVAQIAVEPQKSRLRRDGSEFFVFEVDGVFSEGDLTARVFDQKRPRNEGKDDLVNWYFREARNDLDVHGTTRQLGRCSADIFENDYWSNGFRSGRVAASRSANSSRSHFSTAINQLGRG